MQKEPRDVVVVRVSEQGGREDENFHSPKAQLAKARLWSEAQGNRVVDAFEEIDVSGKLPLARRPGLLRAIELVEAGAADHIVVAYFDRLVRSLRVQLEVIERVERAGGEIYAIDHGRLTNGTAATRMSNNMMGAAFQYYTEVTGEKVAAAQERVVARGVLPNSRISPGYVRGEDGVLVVERPKARIVVQAFKRRDRGASLVEIQAWLAEHGIERSISGVASMLRSRMYLGEIHFGEWHNTCAHEPIIKDRALFERVQRRTFSRGRQAKSERLLARLGVLRCGTCGSRMVITATAATTAAATRALTGASDERRSRPTASRRSCWTRSGRTRPRPTRTKARRASSRSARRTRSSNAPTRLSMTRSDTSASLDCWAGPRARRP
jgi:DNA invertase Pin-like site-specific DNA recombinase